MLYMLYKDIPCKYFLRNDLKYSCLIRIQVTQVKMTSEDLRGKNSAITAGHVSNAQSRV